MSEMRDLWNENKSSFGWQINVLDLESNYKVNSFPKV